MKGRALLGILGLVALAVPPRSCLRGGPRPSRRARRRRARASGLVFDVGGRGDKSFNDAAYEGLRRAEKELDVETRFLEPSGAEDREAALRLFAAEGMDLVIGVGFIFSSDVDVGGA